MGVAGHGKLRRRPSAGRTNARGDHRSHAAFPRALVSGHRLSALPAASFFIFFVSLVPSLVITAPRRGEPAWHRRERRKRGDARALLRVASASRLLAAHHSSQPAEAAAPSMVRGRWARNDDGWFSKEARGRSQSRGRGDRGGGGADKSDREKEYRKENEKLRKELEETRKRVERQQQAHTARPNAKEGTARDGDWLCTVCNFGTNRHQRQACYRCAAARSISFLSPAPLVHPGPSGVQAGIPAPTTSTSTTAPFTSSPPSSSSLSASTSWAGGGGSIGFGFSSSTGAARPGTFAVPGFAGAPLLGMQPTAPTPSSPQPAPCAKSLKAQLDGLLQTRSTVAANPLCAEAVASIDAQITRVRADLSQVQPLEVALRGTLGAVSNARQSLQRAEAKLAKCEQQVVAAVSSYESAAAEAQACRKSLAEAEAATARTAGSHADLRQLFGADPGAAWAAFRLAAEARCIPGVVDSQVLSRAAAAFAEMQAICALLPAQPPPSDGGGTTAAGSATAASSPSSNAGPPLTSATSATAPANGGSAAAAAAGAQPSSASGPGVSPATQSVDPGAVAAASIMATIERQRSQQSSSKSPSGAASVPGSGLSVVLQPSTPEIPSHFEIVAAAALQPTAAATCQDATLSEQQSQSGGEGAAVQRQADDGTSAATEAGGTAQADLNQAQQQAAASTTEARQLLGQAALAAATPTPAQDHKDEDLAPPVVAGAALGTAPAPADDRQAGGGTARAGITSQPGDDDMGGGACSGIANKRPAEAVAAGRAIAAKAKAKVSA